MIPQTQTIVDSKTGDCFRACIASLLEMPIGDVPNFVDDETHSQFDRCNEWLEPRNLQRAFIQMGRMPLPKGYFILTVKSALFPGCTHSVIAEEDKKTGLCRVVWNPNPQDPRGNDIPGDDWLFFDVLAVIDAAKGVPVG